MSIDVKRIAQLAMLEFTDEQAAEFEKEFTQIVKMVENLPALSVQSALVNEADTMQLREDEIVPSLARDELMKNVPHTVAGCIVVPKTMD